MRSLSFNSPIANAAAGTKLGALSSAARASLSASLKRPSLAATLARWYANSARLRLPSARLNRCARTTLLSASSAPRQLPPATSSSTRLSSTQPASGLISKARRTSANAVSLSPLRTARTNRPRKPRNSVSSCSSMRRNAVAAACWSPSSCAAWAVNSSVIGGSPSRTSASSAAFLAPGESPPATATSPRVSARQPRRWRRSSLTRRKRRGLTISQR